MTDVKTGEESEESIPGLRPTPVDDRTLLSSINAVLDTIPDQTATAILQVPQGSNTLRGAVYVNVGSGFSFMTWLDKDLKVKDSLGYGVAVRKTWK
jgi:hypothetical protein